jgi:hypothetical protein
MSKPRRKNEGDLFGADLSDHRLRADAARMKGRPQGKAALKSQRVVEAGPHCLSTSARPCLRGSPPASSGSHPPPAW